MPRQVCLCPAWLGLQQVCLHVNSVHLAVLGHVQLGSKYLTCVVSTRCCLSIFVSLGAAQQWMYMVTGQYEMVSTDLLHMEHGIVMVFRTFKHCGLSATGPDTGLHWNSSWVWQKCWLMVLHVSISALGAKLLIVRLELLMQAFCCPPYGQPNGQRVSRPSSCTVARRAARVTTCGCCGEAACL